MTKSQTVSETPNTSTEITVPDHLLQLLGEESEQGITDVFVDDVQEKFDRPRRVEVPQRTTKKWKNVLGQLVINSAKDDQEPVFTDHLDFLLVEALTHDIMVQSGQRQLVSGEPKWLVETADREKERFPLGGMTHWKFDSTGKRVTTEQSPICASDNGIEPRPFYKGNEIYDFRTGRTEKIGYRFDPVTNQYIETQHGCLGCPFAKWLDSKDVREGQKVDPMCRKSFTYVIYDIDRDELMTITGANMGIQLALTGTRNGKTGHRWDGQIFNGIKYNFAYVENRGNVPTFRNRPEGRPSVENPNAPVYAVRMTVSTNTFEPSTYVPTFTLLDGNAKNCPPQDATTKEKELVEAPTRQLTHEEYGRYLMKQQEYIRESIRGKLMRLDQIIHVSNFSPNTVKPELSGMVDPPKSLTAGSESATDYSDPFPKEGTE